MPPVPAVCLNCGLVFNSGVNLGESSSVRFSNVGADPCPRCGNDTEILDGLYGSLGNTIRVLLETPESVGKLQALVDALKASSKTNASAQQVRETITQHVPELKNLADAVPKTPLGVNEYIKTICAIITVLLGIYTALHLSSKPQPTQEEINKMIEKEVAKILARSVEPILPAILAAPAAPRRDPYPMNRAQRRAAKKGKHK